MGSIDPGSMEMKKARVTDAGLLVWMVEPGGIEIQGYAMYFLNSYPLSYPKMIPRRRVTEFN